MKPRPHPWLPCDYSNAELEAVRAVYAGEGNAHQQRLALDWVINEAAATYDEPFRSDADGGGRDTDYALGRAYVGRNIVKLINMRPDLVAKLRGDK